MKFNVENCDVTMENGSLRLVYHTDKMPLPMVMVVSNSYHDLNEKAMYFFGQDEWVENVVEWSLRKESPIWHNLLADIYKNHHDVYETVMVTPEDAEDEVLGYLTLTATDDVDENTGHRIGRFEKADLDTLDAGILHALADACDIEDSEYMSREELIDALSKQDIDMDDCDYDCDNCECAEKTPEGNIVCHQDEEEEDLDDDACDGDCENCDYADCNDEDDADTQPETPRYEYVDGPAHYNGTECIENMRKLYGDEAVRWFCICNAYKYRFRLGNKPGVSAEQDEEKAYWYENYAAKMMSEQRYY